MQHNVVTNWQSFISAFWHLYCEWSLFFFGIVEWSAWFMILTLGIRIANCALHSTTIPKKKKNDWSQSIWHLKEKKNENFLMGSVWTIKRKDCGRQWVEIGKLSKLCQKVVKTNRKTLCRVAMVCRQHPKHGSWPLSFYLCTSMEVAL